MSTEQLFNQILAASAKEKTICLPERFEGKKHREGFHYFQQLGNRFAYIYEVSREWGREKCYEIIPIVIERDPDLRQNREFYPWEDPVRDKVKVSTNWGAACEMWLEMSRAIDLNSKSM